MKHKQPTQEDKKNPPQTTEVDTSTKPKTNAQKRPTTTRSGYCIPTVTPIGYFVNKRGETVEQILQRFDQNPKPNKKPETPEKPPTR
jgi:hypothetical protein